MRLQCLELAFNRRHLCRRNILRRSRGRNDGRLVHRLDDYLQVRIARTVATSSRVKE